MDRTKIARDVRRIRNAARRLAEALRLAEYHQLNAGAGYQAEGLRVLVGEAEHIEDIAADIQGLLPEYLP